MDVIDAIKSRRSIRKYQSAEVHEEILLKVLDAARWAPSAWNWQPWEFIIIRDEKVKNEIANVARYGRFLKNAPLLIAIVTNPKISPEWHIIDGTCATQNLMLAAWNYGLGTCWIGEIDREKVKKLLDVPEELHLLTVIPLGKPDRVPKTSRRKSLKTIVYNEKYGAK